MLQMILSLPEIKSIHWNALYWLRLCLKLLKQWNVEEIRSIHIDNIVSTQRMPILILYAFTHTHKHNRTLTTLCTERRLAHPSMSKVRRIDGNARYFIEFHSITGWQAWYSFVRTGGEIDQLQANQISRVRCTPQEKCRRRREKQVGCWAHTWAPPIPRRWFLWKMSAYISTRSATL